MRPERVIAARAALTGDDGGRPGREPPDSACHPQPRSLAVHVGALAASGAAGGLTDPRLVLAWLMTFVGAPTGLVGLLVPVREAGRLLPGALLAGAVHRMPRGKWLWVAGSALRGLAALGIALAALTLFGAAAGWTMLGLLAVVAVAGSVSSLAHSDALAKTVAPGRRGVATGAAAWAASLAVAGVALILLLELGPRGAIVLWTVMAAGGLWLAAAAVFALLPEPTGATAGDEGGVAAAWAGRGLLSPRRPLGRFAVASGLLAAAMLAPPYLVALASRIPGEGLAALGAVLLAAALATAAGLLLCSRLAALPSGRLLAGAGCLAAAAIGLALLAEAAGVAGRPAVLAALVFALTLAHQGVRIGTATWLVETAPPKDRATWTTLADIAGGLVVLVAGGALALLAQLAGLLPALAALAVMATLAVPAALALDARPSAAQGR